MVWNACGTVRLRCIYGWVVWNRGYYYQEYFASYSICGGDYSCIYLSF